MPPQSGFDAAVDLHRQGRLVEAEAGYLDLLAQVPDHVDALYNLALIERGRGDFDAALKRLTSVVRLAPDYAAAHLAMGKLHWSRGGAADALACFDQAVALDPGNVDALNCRGNALRGLGRYAEALASLDAALRFQPDYALALANRGHLLAALGRRETAVDSFRRARAADLRLTDTLGPQLEQQLQVCDWSDHADLTSRIAERVGQGAAADLPFSFLSHCASPHLQLACARQRIVERFPRLPPPVWSGQRYDHARIRIAYVSSDFREHAVSHLIAGLIERHDRARFEVRGYALGPSVDDPMRRRLAHAFDIFTDVAGMDDQAVAELIRRDEADIAVDLNGHTTHCRPGVFARRCAPVQINYLGYPGTMGAGFIDYILADRTVIPADEAPAYDEQVIRLPGAYQVNDRSRPIAAVTADRADAGLPVDGFVFCSFNAVHKINPQVFDVWMRLLDQVEGSVLWLLDPGPVAAANLRAEAVQRSVDPARLIFAGRAAPADHLARHRLADLFLDTWPYNAHTTASDALWAGLPLVTLKGSAFAGRVAESLLRAAGLPQLVAADLASYEALALDLARDPDRLAGLRADLMARRDDCALFDTDLSRRHIEAAYEMVHDRTRRGLPPAGFDLPPLGD